MYNTSLLHCLQPACGSARWSTDLSRLAGNLWCGGHGKTAVLRRNGLVVYARPGVSQELSEPLVLLTEKSFIWLN